MMLLLVTVFGVRESSNLNGGWVVEYKEINDMGTTRQIMLGSFITSAFWIATPLGRIEPARVVWQAGGNSALL